MHYYWFYGGHMIWMTISWLVGLISVSASGLLFGDSMTPGKLTSVPHVKHVFDK